MKKGLLFAIISLLVLSFSGCNKNPDEDVISPTFEEFNAEIVPGGTVDAYMLRPDTLNPILTTIDVNKKMLGLCYDSLFYTDKDYNCVPFLAETYEYSSNGKKLTITLRKNIKWHDGSDFTASDVKYTITNILKNEQSPYYSAMTELIGGIKQSGEDKIVLTFNYSDSGAHNLLTFPIIKNGSMKDSSYTPVGTGAFIFNEIENQENYSLKKNNNWAMGHIYIDEINVHVLPDRDSVFSAFNSGMLDFIHISKEDAGKFSVSESVAYSPVYTENYCFMGINFNNPLLSDQYVRKAISAALDKNALAESALTNYASATDLPIHPQAYFYVPAENETFDEFLKTTTSFKKEQGQLTYNNADMRFTLLVNEENTSRLLIAEAITNALDVYGIKITVVKTDFESYVNRIENGEYDLYIGGAKLSKNFDMSPLLSENGALNHGGFYDDDTQTLLTDILKADSPSARSKKLKSLSNRFLETLPHIPLYFENEMIVYNSDKLVNPSFVNSGNIATFIIRCGVKQ